MAICLVVEIKSARLRIHFRLLRHEVLDGGEIGKASNTEFTVESASNDRIFLVFLLGAVPH